MTEEGRASATRLWGRKSVGDISQPRVGSDPQRPPASQNWPPVRSVERRSGPNPNWSCIRCRSDVGWGASAKSKMQIPDSCPICFYFKNEFLPKQKGELP